MVPWLRPLRSEVCQPSRAAVRSPGGPCGNPRGPMAPPLKVRGATPLKVRAPPLEVPCRCPSKSKVRHPSMFQGDKL